MKTIRFSELIAKAGKPTVYQLWSAPAQDRDFKRALKQHRVLTIHQQSVGGRRDYGTVGFQEEPLAQFVVFPQSLRAFVRRRVIGIDYALFAGAKTDASRTRQRRAPGRSTATTTRRVR